LRICSTCRLCSVGMMPVVTATAHSPQSKVLFKAKKPWNLVVVKVAVNGSKTVVMIPIPVLVLNSIRIKARNNTKNLVDNLRTAN
jgi:hypothetical protein